MDFGIKIIPAEKTKRSYINNAGNELKSIEGVLGAGTTQARSIDPASVMLWVKFTAEMIALTGGAITIAQQIFNLLHKNKIPDATIEFMDGTKITLAAASVDDLADLLARSSKSV